MSSGDVKVSRFRPLSRSLARIALHRLRVPVELNIQLIVYLFIVLLLFISCIDVLLIRRTKQRMDTVIKGIQHMAPYHAIQPQNVLWNNNEIDAAFPADQLRKMHRRVVEVITTLERNDIDVSDLEQHKFVKLLIEHVNDQDVHDGDYRDLVYALHEFYAVMAQRIASLNDRHVSERVAFDLLQVGAWAVLMLLVFVPLLDRQRRINRKLEESRYRLERQTASLKQSEHAVHQAVKDLERERDQARHLEELFKTVVESVPRGLVMINSRGEIVMVNGEMQRMFQYEKEELLNRPIDFLMPESYREEHQAVCQRYFETPERKNLGIEQEFFGRRKDNTDIPLEIGLNPIYRDGGETLVLCSVIDITARKRQAEELTQINRELAERNYEMEQFVYSVSHDLKSPLVTSQNFLSFLECDLKHGDFEAAKDSMARLHAANRRMRELIEDLLDLSRIGRQRMQLIRLDMHNMVTAIVEGMQLELQGDVVTVAPDLPEIIGDEYKLKQVFENLLHNALKYARQAEHALVINIGAKVDDDTINFFVQDNGPGIKAEYHNKIFGLFQRLEIAAEGTGIGLAIVKRVAELHQGSAWVESAPGRGATFWFSIARSVQEPVLEENKHV